MKNPEHPGDYLRRTLDIHKVSLADLAEALEMDPSNIRKIIIGMNRISPIMALKFERALGINPLIILNLQCAWEIAKLDYEDLSGIPRLIEYKG